MTHSPFHRQERESRSSTRREFLWRFGGGLGGIALTNLLGCEQLLASGAASNTTPIISKAKRVV